MVAKIAGLDANINKENVIGVELKDIVAEKVGKEMDVMVLLEDLTITCVSSNHSLNFKIAMFHSLNVSVPQNHFQE